MDADRCPEHDFDNHELSVIRFMANDQGKDYESLTGPQMEGLLLEFSDCEKYQRYYRATN